MKRRSKHSSSSNGRIASTKGGLELLLAGDNGEYFSNKTEEVAKTAKKRLYIDYFSLRSN
jgi:hypothetical protein